MALSVLLLAALVHADSPERLKSAADFVFSSPVLPQAPTILKQDEGQALTEEQKKEMEAFLMKLGKSTSPKSDAKSAKGPTTYLRLSDIRNGYWRTAAQFTLNGKPTTVGFGVSRGQEAYMSVLSHEAPAPALLNIKGLLDSAKGVNVNGRGYSASLSPNIFDKLASKLKIAGHGESRQFKLRDLIGASFDKGFNVPIGDQSYRLFYYDDVAEASGYGNIVADRQNVTLVVRNKDDFEIFILPAEEIPTGHMAVYALHGGAKLGLQRVEGGTVLAMRANP